MFKFVSRNKRKILAILGVLSMVSFLYGLVSNNNGSKAATAVGTIDGINVAPSEDAQAGQEWDLLTKRLYISPDGQNQMYLANALFTGAAGGSPEDGLALVNKVDRTTYMLLVHEAEAEKIVIDDKEFSEIKGMILGAPEPADVPVTTVDSAIRHLLMIQEVFEENVMASVKSTTPQRLHLAAAQEASVNLRVVSLPTTAPSTAPDDPTLGANINSQTENDWFQKYKDNLPDPADDASLKNNPFGWGYKFPDRVKIEYLAIPKQDLANRVESTIQKLSLQRLIDDPRFFPLPPDPNATNPSTTTSTTQTQPVALIPAIPPQTPQQRYQLGLDAARHLLAQELVVGDQLLGGSNPQDPSKPQFHPGALADIRDKVVNKMDDDFRDWDRAVNESNKPAPPSSLSTQDNQILYTSLLYLPALADYARVSLNNDYPAIYQSIAKDSIGAKSVPLNVAPIVRQIDGWKTADDLKTLDEGAFGKDQYNQIIPGIANWTQSVQNPYTRQIIQENSFSTFVMNHVDAFLTPDQKKVTHDALKLWQESPVLEDETQGWNNGYLFVYRLTDLDPSHSATDLDEIVDSPDHTIRYYVRRDMLANEKYARTLADADNLQQIAQQSNLDDAAQKLRDPAPEILKNVHGPDARAAETADYRAVLGTDDPQSIRKFRTEALEMMIDALHSGATRLVRVIQLPRAQRIIVAEFRPQADYSPIHNDPTNTIISISLGTQDSLAAYRALAQSWFDPQNVQTRLNFKPAPVDKTQDNGGSQN